MLARAERFADVGFRGPREDGNAAPRLVGDDLGDAAPLVGTEPRELARRPVGIQTVNAAVDQPIDVPAEFRLVDFARIVLGHQVGRKDAPQPFLVAIADRRFQCLRLNC